MKYKRLIDYLISSLFLFSMLIKKLKILMRFTINECECRSENLLEGDKNNLFLLVFPHHSNQSSNVFKCYEITRQSTIGMI